MAPVRRTDDPPAHRVLILGGGFAGIYTALGLERELGAGDRVEVTLVSRENFFLFTPFLCEVASSAIDTTHAINPIRRLFHRTRFMEGEATGLDLGSRTATILHPDGHTRNYGYDQLVVALGAQTGFFGMHDVQEHALTAKTLGDAIYLRNWAIEMLEIAAVEQDPATRNEALTFVVGGGGFTGVEMAGELHDLLRQASRAYPTIKPNDIRVVLVEAMPRLMPEFDPKLARFAHNELRGRGVEVRLNTRVTGATARSVQIKDAAPIPTRTLVWTSGVAPNPLIAKTALPTDQKGWITVDAQLRVEGLDGVWALGDCAHIPDPLRPGKFQPALAQHAIREAHQLARNITATLRGAPPRPFLYRSKGQMATLGHYKGIGLIGPVKVSGFLAWAIWRSYYLWQLPRVEKRLRVALDWTADLLFGRDISQFAVFRATDTTTRSTDSATAEVSGG